MKRIHLFEFEDLAWFPTFLRNYGTDFLQFLANRTKMYEPIIPLLEKGLKQTDNNKIIDLGSGGGGGMRWLNTALKHHITGLTITLTDFYPNLAAFEFIKNQTDNIDYIINSVDARNVPNELRGLRTQFLSLHHFRPTDAKRILQNAVESKQPIAIIEAQERSVLSLISMFFSPLTVLVTTPFIRPFSWGRLVFTYLIPIVPFFVMWDGIVSSLRTYSVMEMRSLVSSVEGHESFEWEIGKTPSGPGVLLYLLGTRKQ